MPTTAADCNKLAAAAKIEYVVQQPLLPLVQRPIVRKAVELHHGGELLRSACEHCDASARSIRWRCLALCATRPVQGLGLQCNCVAQAANVVPRALHLLVALLQSLVHLLQLLLRLLKLLDLLLQPLDSSSESLNGLRRQSSRLVGRYASNAALHRGVGWPFHASTCGQDKDAQSVLLASKSNQASGVWCSSWYL